ncbi:MAG TPA: hypothetical protein VKB38_06535 [Terracidiphilus sp.]|nr:hypothetical protein [Terracidiphilus sp.]
MGFNGDELLARGPEAEQPLGGLVDVEAGSKRLIERQNSERIAALEVEHEELIVKRRRLEETEGALLAERAQLMVNAAPVESAVRNADSALKSAWNQAPNAKFASRAEVQAHDERVALAQKSLAEATARQKEHNAQVVKWRSAEVANQEVRKKLDRQIEETRRDLQTLRGVKMPPPVNPSTGTDQ